MGEVQNVSKSRHFPLKMVLLGRLQWHLWDSDPHWFGWRSRVANAISSVRYWAWRATGGRHL